MDTVFLSEIYDDDVRITKDGGLIIIAFDVD